MDVFPVHTKIPNRFGAATNTCYAEVRIARRWIQIPFGQQSGLENAESGMTLDEAMSHPCPAVVELVTQFVKL
jgi:hypothetical protein